MSLTKQLDDDSPHWHHHCHDRDSHMTRISLSTVPGGPPGHGGKPIRVTVTHAAASRPGAAGPRPQRRRRRPARGQA